jgi:hypothetical protein
MSLLNIAASLVKVGCSVAINLFIMYSCISFIPLFVTSIIRILINDFHGEITCSRADEDLIFFLIEICTVTFNIVTKPVGRSFKEMFLHCFETRCFDLMLPM